MDTPTIDHSASHSAVSPNLKRRASLRLECARRAEREPEFKLAAVLAEWHPQKLTANQLMIKMSLPIHPVSVTSFVHLCTLFSRINRVLPVLGWQVVRTGGTPKDFYQLERVNS